MDESKFILDSNVWISYIITDSLDDLIRALVKNQIQIYADRYLLKEISDVLLRPKFRKYLRAPISKFMEVIELTVIATQTKSFAANLPDPKDNFLIALAHSSQVKKVVTGDKPLLAMKSYRGVEFMSLTEFRKLLNS